ncbi:hypothetical protein, partial [Streptomyces hirsutus]|uniref:hypothetical protein n=1 Tax=Streptomyces hirsutus TaxID=35620 RepID=UPI00365FFFAF
MATARTVLVALADRLDTQPSRPVDLHVVRGWARSAGLTGDWVGILPPPAGAHPNRYGPPLSAPARGHPATARAP